MKKMKKVISLCIVLTSMFAQSVTVMAKESTFIEIPSEQQYVKENDGEEISSLAVEASLTSCDLGIGINSNGVSVTYTTRATVAASEIGIKNLVLKEKTLFGWKEIQIGGYSTNNSDYYNGGIVYTQAVPGKTYYATCTHYAIINGKEYTLGNQTSELVYN